MSSTPVKPERHDEAEIRELAAKLAEEQKKKLSMPAPMVMATLNGPSHLARSNSIKMVNNHRMDQDSVMGRFGWLTVGQCHIPYITRNGDKYCAVRMVETKLLKKYPTAFHQDIYRCACVRSYYVTHVEAQLLNDINFNHSNYQFGRVMFTERDLIVTLRDAEELLKFLDACYVRILKGDKDSLERFAFIRINRESAVPFTLHNNEKCLPLFYFEGEIDNLNLQARKLEGWDLAYLKFCCRIQGIKRELYDYDTCPVVSLREIENYFPPDTVFDCHWPSKVDTSPLLVRGRNQVPSGQWAKPPSAAPLKS